MKIEREPQWPELEQRLHDWENPEIPTNKYNINATYTPANFFFLIAMRNLWGATYTKV